MVNSPWVPAFVQRIQLLEGLLAIFHRCSERGYNLPFVCNEARARGVIGVSSKESEDENNRWNVVKTCFKYLQKYDEMDQCEASSQNFAHLHTISVTLMVTLVVTPSCRAWDSPTDSSVRVAGPQSLARYPPTSLGQPKQSKQSAVLRRCDPGFAETCLPNTFIGPCLEIENTVTTVTTVTENINPKLIGLHLIAKQLLQINFQWICLWILIHTPVTWVSEFDHWFCFWIWTYLNILQYTVSILSVYYSTLWSRAFSLVKITACSSESDRTSSWTIWTIVTIVGWLLTG